MRVIVFQGIIFLWAVVFCFFFVIFTMHQNGSLTCEQMDKRLDDTVEKRDVDKGLGLATNLCPAALWVATQI